MNVVSTSNAFPKLRRNADSDERHTTDCGNELVAGAALALESSCNMGCAGNAKYV